MTTDMPTDRPANQAAPRSVHEIDGKFEPCRLYTLIDENEERFTRSAEQIIAANHLQTQAHVWWDNFNGACRRVESWCDNRKGSVSVALVHLCSDKVVFFVIPNSEQIDYELCDAQTDLELELNGQAGIGYVEARQIPRWEVERFVDRNALRVWPPSTGTKE